VQLNAGVDHTFQEVEGLAHERPKMINQYRAIWFGYDVSRCVRLHRPTPRVAGSSRRFGVTIGDYRFVPFCAFGLPFLPRFRETV
jgi:hypothetical protein